MRLNVQGKLYALAGLLLLFLAAVGFLAIKNLGAVHTLGASMYGDRVVPLVQLGNARSLAGDIDGQILLAVADPAHEATYAATADKAASELDAQVKEFEATNLVAADKAALAEFPTHWDAYRTSYHAVIAAAKSGDKAGAERAYFQARPPPTTRSTPTSPRSRRCRRPSR